MLRCAVGVLFVYGFLGKSESRGAFIARGKMWPTIIVGTCGKGKIRILLNFMLMSETILF